MQNHCRECRLLIESMLISEPHHVLKPIVIQQDAQLYQCDDCASCFIFTRQDIALLALSESELKQLKAAS